MEKEGMISGFTMDIMCLIPAHLFVGKLNDPKAAFTTFPPGSACRPTLADVGGHRLDSRSCSVFV